MEDSSSKLLSKSGKSILSFIRTLITECMGLRLKNKDVKILYKENINLSEEALGQLYKNLCNKLASDFEYKDLIFRLIHTLQLRLKLLESNFTCFSANQSAALIISLCDSKGFKARKIIRGFREKVLKMVQINESLEDVIFGISLLKHISQKVGLNFGIYKKFSGIFIEILSPKIESIIKIRKEIVTYCSLISEEEKLRIAEIIIFEINKKYLCHHQSNQVRGVYREKFQAALDILNSIKVTDESLIARIKQLSMNTSFNLIQPSTMANDIGHPKEILVNYEGPSNVKHYLNEPIQIYRRKGITYELHLGLIAEDNAEIQDKILSKVTFRTITRPVKECLSKQIKNSKYLEQLSNPYYPSSIKFHHSTLCTVHSEHRLTIVTSQYTPLRKLNENIVLKNIMPLIDTLDFMSKNDIYFICLTTNNFGITEDSDIKLVDFSKILEKKIIINHEIEYGDLKAKFERKIENPTFSCYFHESIRNQLLAKGCNTEDMALNTSKSVSSSRSGSYIRGYEIDSSMHDLKTINSSTAKLRLEWLELYSLGIVLMQVITGCSIVNMSNPLNDLESVRDQTLKRYLEVLLSGNCTFSAIYSEQSDRLTSNNSL